MTELRIAQPKRRFAAPRWTTDSPEWQALDRQLPPDHKVRWIAALVHELDFAELEGLYAGVGSQAYPPELMLAIALYEALEGHLAPAAWARHARESLPVQWLAMGIQPGRSAMDNFRSRLDSVIAALVKDILAIAKGEGFIRTQQGVLDGTTIRSQGSRHRLLNQAGLTERIDALERAVAEDAAGQPPSEPPAWMARTAQGRRGQLQRHLEAQAVLQRRLAENAQKPKDRRLEPEQVRVCVSDPEAPLGRDKEKVFCPLYTAQLIIEPSSLLVVAFDVFAQATDAGTLPPMLDQAQKMLDRALETAITDAGYVSILDLQACEQRKVQLIAPIHENDYTQDKKHSQDKDQTPVKTPTPSRGPTQGKGSTRGKKRRRAKRPPLIGKDQFTWDPQEQTYRCPQGHTMPHVKQQRKRRRHGESVVIHQYQCPATFCQQCPLSNQCVKDPSKGRTVMRTEGEELLEAHRLKMATPEAQELKKLRGQVIERGFGDAKQHRDLRRFHGRGCGSAKVELGLVVLAQNMLMLHRLRRKAVKPVEVAA